MHLCVNSNRGVAAMYVMCSAAVIHGTPRGQCVTGAVAAAAGVRGHAPARAASVGCSANGGSRVNTSVTLVEVARRWSPSQRSDAIVDCDIDDAFGSLTTLPIDLPQEEISKIIEMTTKGLPLLCQFITTKAKNLGTLNYRKSL